MRKLGKRMAAILLAAAMVCVSIPVSIAAVGVSGDFSYGISDGEVTVTGYHGKASEVVLPDTIEGCPVTSVAKWAFFDKASIESVTIPETVKTIQDQAFMECDSLKSVVLHEGLTSIGYHAFAYCSSLENITLPESLTSIGLRAFEDCAFTSVVIPKNVTAIARGVFMDCPLIQSITVDAENPVYHAQDHCLIETATDTVIAGCQNSRIPEGIVTVAPSAFSGCHSLKSIVLPDSVTAIGEFAFYDCYSLNSITLGGSVASIGQYAFNRCTALKSITFPDSLTTIANAAFYECRGLQSVTIPTGVTRIGALAFSGCDALASIAVSPDNENYCSENGVLFSKDKSTLLCYPIGKKATEYEVPVGVKTIEARAFYKSQRLKTVVIPEGVTQIGALAFYRCYALTKVSLPASLTSFEKTLFADSFMLSNVYYGGSERQWDTMLNGIVPDLNGATVHFAKKIGDVTGDGELNMMDVLGGYSGVSGGEAIGNEHYAVIDVNGDGVCNMLDILALYQNVSGKVLL